MSCGTDCPRQSGRTGVLFVHDDEDSLEVLAGWAEDLGYQRADRVGTVGSAPWYRPLRIRRPRELEAWLDPGSEAEPLAGAGLLLTDNEMFDNLTAGQQIIALRRGCYGFLTSASTSRFTPPGPHGIGAGPLPEVWRVLFNWREALVAGADCPETVRRLRSRAAAFRWLCRSWLSIAGRCAEPIDREALRVVTERLTNPDEGPLWGMPPEAIQRIRSAASGLAAALEDAPAILESHARKLEYEEERR